MPAAGCAVLAAMLLLPLPPPLHAAKRCPGRCLCYESSDLVDCRSRGLVRVPPRVPRGTWLLDLNGNQLTEVQRGSFAGLWALKVLLVSNNSIQTLQPQFHAIATLYISAPQCLSSLRFLERLDLSSNRLRGLPRDFSQSLSSLQELQLARNLLRDLDSASLAGLGHLRKLDLSHNRILAVDVAAFGGLFRLSLLDLSGNGLTELGDGVLSRQQRLEVLLLGRNNISRIGTRALAPLRSLRLFGLRGNQLEHIRFKTFLALQTTSTHLQLSLNPWTCDCELQRVFSKIRDMRRLHVDDYQELRCGAPARQAGSLLAALDSQLCIAETASVLVITITVILAVVGTLMKAERDRSKNKQTAGDADSERPEQ
ncbi:reticulon-4 receptor-like 2 [Clinocottus analis]|uniref:reticulon-4 receptor-like 2 n=1 Tax=Clinocottus analis TaxID=304258 RepID=UPI0035C10607